MSRTHFSGPLRYRRGNGVVKMLGGSPACGAPLAIACITTTDPAEVDCRRCSKCLALADESNNGDAWNWCPRCNQLVDADDVHDGSEVKCHGCDRWFVVEQYTDGAGAISFELARRNGGGR